MLAYLISTVGFVLALMLQYGIFSRWTLLAGSADVVLLFIIAWCLHERSRRGWILVLVFGVIVGFISAMPWFFPVGIYMAVYLAARYLRVWVWQTPLLGMFLLTFVATLLTQLATIAYMFVMRLPFSVTDALINVTLPSLLLNIFMSIPVHAIVIEMARSAYPKGLENE